MSEDKLTKRAIDALEYVNSLEVTDQESLNLANKVLVRIGQVQKAINDFFNPLINKAHVAHKALCDKKKEVIGPVLRADNFAKQKVRIYMREQERIQQEALAKVRQAEEDKKKLEEDALKKAQALQDEGKVDEALDVLDETAEMVDEIKTEVPTGPVMSGTHVKKVWLWKLDNIDEVPRHCMVLDKIKINGMVRQGARTISGLIIYEDIDISRSRT